MLKLLSALMTQAPQISEVINRVNSTPVHERTITLTPTITRGLLTLSAHELNDLDLSELYTEHSGLKTARNVALSRLSGASLGEVTQLFLEIEDLVMRSGRGVTFDAWRRAWRDALCVWLKSAEISRWARVGLATLVELSDEQRSLTAKHLDVTRRAVRELTREISPYLDISSSGESALGSHVVVWVPAPIADHVTRYIEESEDVMRDQLTRDAHTPQALGLDEFDRVADRVAERAPLYLRIVTRRFAPLSSIVELAQSLLDLVDQPRAAQLDHLPLLASLIGGGELPDLYQQTPPESRFIWLSRELSTLFVERLSSVVKTRRDQSRGEPVIFWVTDAQRMSAYEAHLWASCIKAAQVHHIPIAVIALMSDYPTELSGDGAASAHHTRALQHVFSDHDISLVQHRVSADVGAELTRWDLDWCRALSWRHELTSEAPLLNVWREGIRSLSPPHQRVLLDVALGRAKRTLRVDPAYEQRRELIDQLERAGWINESGGVYRAMTRSLNHALKLLCASPEHLDEAYPQLAATISAREVAQSSSTPDHLSLDSLAFEHTRAWLQVAQRPDAEARQRLERLSARVNERLFIFGLTDREDRRHSDLLSASGWESLAEARSLVELGAPDGVERDPIHDQADHFDHFDHYARRALEIGSATADYELIAHVTALRGAYIVAYDDPIEGVMILDSAHTLWRAHPIPERARREMTRCRLEIIMTLARVGASRLALALLELSDGEALDEVEPLYWSDAKLIRAMCCVARNDWLGALSLTRPSELALTHIESRSLEDVEEIDVKEIDTKEIDASSLPSSEVNAVSAVSAMSELSEAYHALAAFELSRSDRAPARSEARRALLERAHASARALDRRLRARPELGMRPELSALNTWLINELAREAPREFSLEDDLELTEDLEDIDRADQPTLAPAKPAQVDPSSLNDEITYPSPEPTPRSLTRIYELTYLEALSARSRGDLSASEHLPPHREVYHRCAPVRRALSELFTRDPELLMRWCPSTMSPERAQAKLKDARRQLDELSFMG